MNISACMIVRDEEKNLPRCLDSIKDWVDEIIIVDTGSKDKTVEIAESYGAKVFHQEWQNNFSFHRNHSMDQANGEWLFIIDADEEVLPEDGMAMKAMLADGIKANVVVVDLLNVYGDEKFARSHAGQIRFFRRVAKCRYVRAKHNQPDIRSDMPVWRVPFRIIHHGYDLSSEEMQKKYTRDIKMCKDLVAEDENNAEGWWHLARAMKVKHGKFNMDDIDLIESALDSAIKLSDGKNDRQNTYLQCLYLMAVVKYMRKDHQASAKYAEMAVKIKPDYLDAIFMAGFAYTYGIDASIGEAWLRRYLSEQEIYNFSDVVDSISMEHAQARGEAYKALVHIEELKDRQFRAIPEVT